MFSAHIIKKQLLAMWKIEDLEWRGYLVYNTICGYIQYNGPKAYGMLDFTVSYLGLYALKYYYILKIEYCNYTIAIKSPDVDTQPSQ
jgi:hypothetical protein